MLNWLALSTVLMTAMSASMVGYLAQKDENLLAALWVIPLVVNLYNFWTMVKYYFRER